jgi:hypothetical protein
MPFRITGPDGIKQHFILIGIELAHREAAASGQPAECVGNPWWQIRHVVEGKNMAIVGVLSSLLASARLWRWLNPKSILSASRGTMPARKAA